MEAGCQEGTIKTAVVSPQTSHCHHLVVQVVGILSINAWCSLLFVPCQIVVVQ